MKNDQPIQAGILSTTYKNFNQHHYDKGGLRSGGWLPCHNYTMAILLPKDYGRDTVLVPQAAELPSHTNFSDADLCVDERQWSRRDLFRCSLMAMATGTIIGINPISPLSSTVSANPLVWWTVEAVFAAAIGWYVARVLDAWVDAKATYAKVTPTPSGGRDKFHDRHGDPDPII